MDNIPGVEGIGPKTAQQILSVCMSVEDVAIDDAMTQRLGVGADGGSVKAAVDRVLAEFGSIDVLVLIFAVRGLS